MEIVKQSQEEPAIPTAAPRQPWRFHLLVTLSMLQVLGHAINHYHLILLKPLPILLLVLLCEGATRQQRAFRLGLFFSLGGDLFLMAKTAAMFQLGTLLFMVAHVLYIRVFLYDISWGRLRQLRRKRRLLLVASIALVLTLLMFNISQLWHKTPNLPLFFIYGLVLSLMAVMASLRQGCGSSYVLVLLGAVMFGISDNALAYLKFNGIETEMGSAFVMLTYYAAQCLLYEGVRVNKSVSLD